MTSGDTEMLQRLETVARRALAAWPIEASHLTLIKHRENTVYRVDTAKGERYALRLHRQGYHSDAALGSELQWIDALNRSGIEVPRVVPTTSGELFVSVEAVQVDLFDWVEGQQLGSVENGMGEDRENIQRIYHTLGQCAADLHNQASHWPLPHGFERHAWDLEGLVGETPFWGRFWELDALTDEQRQLILTAREKIQRELDQYGRNSENYGLIHADFVPENLLVDGEHVRLIDFDDAGFGWHMFELATALYFIQDEPHYDWAQSALLAGYQAHRPLKPRDLATLPLFLTSRGFTYLGWVQSRQETETARELTPQLVQLACDSARRYLQL